MPESNERERRWQLELQLAREQIARELRAEFGAKLDDLRCEMFGELADASEQQADGMDAVRDQLPRLDERLKAVERESGRFRGDVSALQTKVASLKAQVAANTEEIRRDEPAAPGPPDAPRVGWGTALLQALKNFF